MLPDSPSSNGYDPEEMEDEEWDEEDWAMINETEEDEVTTTSDDADDYDDGLRSQWERLIGRGRVDATENFFMHAADCYLPAGVCYDWCEETRRFMIHMGKCTKRRTEGCPRCQKQVAMLVFHSKFCERDCCQIPFCRMIKEAIKCYPPDSWYMTDLDHLTHRVLRRLQDLSPLRQTLEEEEGEAEAAGSSGIDWTLCPDKQVEEISSSTAD
ncbi:Protein CBG15785 [Caenorhabditis briggsae]|uniref:histone acetyltransferase n=2 Tax=Caenorhabditis briggsae TaxID=6238 RepID=A0AAE9ILY6_CAEBR|nr:Protein CBG15785 [Caenorhabditis briggsae]ULT98848.1 hypothetical protein L3Y34_000299 [Caenorhabditis briggsae]UMM21535.1 hypothetical protein L5515_003172 [Caenorhabditis briggsae]CAP33957.1 Protein CBG15785 [Caenorhabditis briggsae]